MNKMCDAAVMDSSNSLNISQASNIDNTIVDNLDQSVNKSSETLKEGPDLGTRGKRKSTTLSKRIRNKCTKTNAAKDDQIQLNVELLGLHSAATVQMPAALSINTKTKMSDKIEELEAMQADTLVVQSSQSPHLMLLMWWTDGDTKQYLLSQSPPQAQFERDPKHPEQLYLLANSAFVGLEHQQKFHEQQTQHCQIELSLNSDQAPATVALHSAHSISRTCKDPRSKYFASPHFFAQSKTTPFNALKTGLVRRAEPQSPPRFTSDSKSISCVPILRLTLPFTANLDTLASTEIGNTFPDCTDTLSCFPKAFKVSLDTAYPAKTPEIMSTTAEMSTPLAVANGYTELQLRSSLPSISSLLLPFTESDQTQQPMQPPIKPSTLLPITHRDLHNPPSSYF
ncbi:hypothetical protein BSLG_005752 [Batrachochytrium salamandrivorans]|nr:hypothetical protein BSLG_005752 [Batrachochytrium salamandrivorans]